MHAFVKRTVLQIILIIAFAAVLRAVVLELDKIECGEAPYKQFEFACDMSFFVLPTPSPAAHPSYTNTVRIRI